VKFKEFINFSSVSRAYRRNTAFNPSHTGRTYAAGSTPSRSLGNILVPGKFQAGAGPRCSRLLPSHPQSQNASLNALLPSVLQHPAEQLGSRQVRPALDVTSAGGRQAVRPPSKLLSFSHGAVPLFSVTAAGMERVQRSRALASPRGMSK